MVSLEVQQLLKHCFTELLGNAHLFNEEVQKFVWREAQYNASQNLVGKQQCSEKVQNTNIQMDNLEFTNGQPLFEEFLAEKYGGTFSYVYPHMFRYAYFFIFHGGLFSVRIHGKEG